MSQTGHNNHASNLAFERERGVNHILITRNVAHVVIRIEEDASRYERILEALRSLANSHIPIFLLKLHSSALTLAFAGVDAQAAAKALHDSGFKTHLREDLAIVAVQADSMRDLSGVMVQIADALFMASARLYETGDSHNSVQALIEGSKVEAAVKSLLQTFTLDGSAVSESQVDP